MTEEERSRFMMEGFTLDQIDEIQQGQKEGLDVSVYARKEYFAIQMRQIRLGLLDGIDVKRYANPNYDWFQMEEIRKGLRNQIDVDIYSDPSISYDCMRQVRKGLELGIDLSRFKSLPAGIIRQVRKAYLAKINITEYIKEGYDPEQLEEIRTFLEQGVNVKPYLSVGLRAMAIRQICEGVAMGLDVSVYAKEYYNWRQMKEIRIGMENRIDVTEYTNPLYSWQQMYEIRIGLENGIDVNQYRSFIYTAAEMKKRRLQLEENGEYLDDGRLEEILNQGEEKVTFPDFIVMVSDNEMEAYVVVDGAGKNLNRADIELALRQEGIRQGIDYHAIKMLEQGTYTDLQVRVAEGREAQRGEDGWYEYFFRTNVARTPKILPDGSVDYQNIEWYEIVEQGQKIAVYHDASKGVNGYTVRGRVLPAKRGREKKILTGRGFTLESDQRTYRAAIDGKIELQDERIEILRLLVVDEVSIASGNVNFDGSVYIKGDVGTGARIEVTEDVVVDGYVEDAIIECGGNAILRKGMNSGGAGYIRAGKSVIGKFFESAKVHVSEDIRADYCMNCELYAEGKILISGTNGSLMGGISCATGGMKVDNLGNKAAIATYIKLGINDSIRNRIKQMEETIAGVEHELDILRHAYSDFLVKYSPEVRNTMEMFLKVESAIFTKEKEMDQLAICKMNLEEDIDQMKKVKAVVKDSLYDGVTIEVNGIVWKSKAVKAVTISNAGKQVVAYANR